MSVPLLTLDAVAIATPCHVPWSAMHGDDRSRFCSECGRPVFDLAAMTTAEATELLADPAGPPCVRLYRRPDGRVMTSDCPVGMRVRVWRRVRRRAAWAASLFAMLLLPACRMATQGAIDVGVAHTGSAPPQDEAASPPRSADRIGSQSERDAVPDPAARISSGSR